MSNPHFEQVINQLFEKADKGRDRKAFLESIMKAAGINQDIIDKVIVDGDLSLWGPAAHFLNGDWKTWDELRKTLPGIKDDVIQSAAS